MLLNLIIQYHENPCFQGQPAPCCGGGAFLLSTKQEEEETHSSSQLNVLFFGHSETEVEESAPCWLHLSGADYSLLRKISCALDVKNSIMDRYKQVILGDGAREEVCLFKLLYNTSLATGKVDIHINLSKVLENIFQGLDSHCVHKAGRGQIQDYAVSSLLFISQHSVLSAAGVCVRV